MSKTKKYFPHSIEAVMNTEYPDDVPVDEFMEMRVEYWNIPSSIACIIRTSNNKTGQVQEYSYQRIHAARNKVVALAQNEDLEILIVNDESIVGLNNDHIGRLGVDDDDDGDVDTGKE